MSKLKLEHGISRIRRAKLQSSIDQTVADDIESLAEWSNDELEAIGVAAGGGGMGATVCPGVLAAARAATLAMGFSGSSAGSAGKSGNDASGT